MKMRSQPVAKLSAPAPLSAPSATISVSFYRNYRCNRTMLRIPHCLDNRLKDGGNFISPTHQPRSNPQKYCFSAFGTHFC
jgi:hypothetical protein